MRVLNGIYDRPVRMLVILIVVALGLSVAIPFAVVSVRDGIPAGLRWALAESGVVGALIGCSIVAAITRRRPRHQVWKPSDEASPDEGAPPTAS